MPATEPVSATEDDRRSGERVLPEVEPFALSDYHGEVVSRLKPRALEGEVRRLVDPAAATETIHWGRNYLYRTCLEAPSGPVDVVVKQFRNQGFKARLLRRWRDSKAERSFRAARAFQQAGLPTAEAVMLVEATRPDGPSFVITRHLDGVIEARYLLRAARSGRERADFPEIDFESFLDDLGRTLRRMHDRGLFHRDLSIGNVLLKTGPAPRDGGRGHLYIIDLNRARFPGRVSLSQRIRDLCRLSLRREHQTLLLTAYWGGPVSRWKSLLYRLYHHGFLFRIESKKKIRSLTRRLRDWILPRSTHVHIPEAPDGASVRDKAVWDHLSDQPHQHAGKLEKILVRLADAPNHVRQSVTFLAAAPRIWRRYRQLKKDLHCREVPWSGVGIGLRPLPQAPEALLAAIDDLGVGKVLLRLHPWENDHRHEEELARELAGRGLDLAFALPQNRDLVRDPERWRHQIEELAERFAPHGRSFQIGQAINRSKWGIWRYDEYLALASIATEILRRYPGVEILGPAVIDFEFHVTAAVLSLPRVDFRFDVLSSLLYVDRRGAAENSQLGLDSVDKVVLLRAIAETACNCEPRSWITEVNWPLWEGPHSPAGRSVSVDEDTQADYLARFFLLTLASGAVERVYWWQLVARGYGLIAPREVDGRLDLRRRPGFAALATLVRQLRGAVFLRPLAAPPGASLYLFRRRDGGELVAGWSASGRQRANLPRPARAIVARDGERQDVAGSSEAGRPGIELSPSVRYFLLG